MERDHSLLRDGRHEVGGRRGRGPVGEEEGEGEYCMGENASAEDPVEEAAPGEARPSLSSEGAGVMGGVSGMAGMGWSLKHADS